MTADKACWTYRGPATLFVGKFSSGQTISAQMTGEAIEYDPRSGTRRESFAPARSECRGAGRILLWRSGRAGRSHLCRACDRNLSPQLLALRHVGRGGRGQDLRPLNGAERFDRRLGRAEDERMTCLWTIIGVANVPRSFRWHQSLLGLPETAPAHNYFGQIVDAGWNGPALSP